MLANARFVVHLERTKKLWRGDHEVSRLGHLAFYRAGYIIPSVHVHSSGPSMIVALDKRLSAKDHPFEPETLVTPHFANVEGLLNLWGRHTLQRSIVAGRSAKT